MIRIALLACTLPFVAPAGGAYEDLKPAIVAAARAVVQQAAAERATAALPTAQPSHSTDAAPAAPDAGGAQDDGAPAEDLSFWDFTNTREALRPTRFGLSVGGGIGMIRTGSPYTLRKGELATGINVMNFDRYPGDVDVVEGMLQFALGVTDRIEIFARLSPNLRTNSVAQDPVNWPIPPLDLFIDTYPNPAVRSEPYFMYAQEFPYKTYPYWSTNIDPPGNGAFATSTGDNLFGLKFNLLSEDRGAWGGFGIRPYVELSTETPGYNDIDTYAERAGSAGKTDLGIDFLFSKTKGAAEMLFNVGYKHIGDPKRGLRVQLVNSGAIDPADFLVGDPIETILDLRDEATFDFGITFPLVKFSNYAGELWFIGEFSYTRYVGHGTPTERLVHPAEMRLGAQYNLPFARSVSLGFVWQLMFNDAGDGSLRLGNFLTPDGRGDVNFGELVDADFSEEVKQYFLQRGATFSEHSAKVFATDNPAFDGWRNISGDPQTVIGQGGGAALFFLTWRIAQLW